MLTIIKKKERPYIEPSDKLVPVPEFEHLYMVNNKGNVFSIKNQKFIVCCKTGDYFTANLYNAKGEIKIKRFLVHRLVAMLFVPNPDNLPEVNHDNGNKDDNNAYNLYWCTKSENIKHSYDIGLRDNANLKNSIRKRKLNEIQVKEVELLKKQGFGATYISRELDLPYAAVRNFMEYGYMNVIN